MGLIEIDSKSLQKAIETVKKEYGYISEDKLNTAISRALNRTAQQTKTSAGREIRKVYNIGIQEWNRSAKVRYSQARTLTAAVVSTGEPLSLNKFQAKQVGDRSTTSFDRKGVASSRLNRKSRNKATKSGVTATIKKGEEINLPTAFIQVANGGITVFARGKYKAPGEGFEFGKSRLPIGKITTTSVPLMFANESVMQPTLQQAESLFSERVIHEINYILSR